MKHVFRVGAALALLVLSRAGAEESASPASSMSFATIDADRNGQISLDEYTSYRKPFSTQRFRGLDRNRDGAIDPAEYEFAREKSEARLRQLVPDDPQREEYASVPPFTEVDTDHDGAIRPDELDVAQQAALNKRFTKMDTNGDGVLSLSEFDLARRRFLQLLGEHGGGD